MVAWRKERTAGKIPHDSENLKCAETQPGMESWTLCLAMKTMADPNYRLLPSKGPYWVDLPDRLKELCSRMVIRKGLD